MLNRVKVLFDVYESYRGDSGWHKIRVATQLVLSVGIALYSVNLSTAALPAMALSVSVLAGFTFTALFASGSLSTHDLPEARSESDRADLANLDKITANFRVRARMFLVTSVACLGLVLLLSIHLDWMRIGQHLVEIGIKNSQSCLRKAMEIHENLSKVVVFSTFVVFLELLYLFYRLSESIFSILDTRRSYLLSVEETKQGGGTKHG